MSDLDKILSRIEGSTAFAGEPIEPVKEVASILPVMVFSDIHARRHSAEWISQGMLAAKKFKSRILVAELHDFEYTNFSLNDMPEPMNGFAAIFGNTIQVFDKFTPWDEWGLPRMKGKK